MQRAGRRIPEAVEEIERLRRVEQKAWDRLLRARDIYAEYLASEES